MLPIAPTVISAMASTWIWGPRTHVARTVGTRRERFGRHSQGVSPACRDSQDNIDPS